MLARLRAALERRLQNLASGPRPPPPAVRGDTRADSLRAQGNAFISAGKLDSAEDCFRAALAIDADDPRSLVCLGYVLKEQGRLAEARVALRGALERSVGAPDQFETCFLYGQVCEQEGDLAQAERYYAESLRQEPSFSHACKALCGVVERQGRGDAIRGILERSVAASPKTIDYRLWLADIYEAALDFQGVADQLRAAIALGHASPATLMTLGAALCRTGDVDEAARVMAQAAAIDAGVAADVEYHLGYFHVRSGDAAAGLAHLERCVALRPDFGAAHSLILLTLSHAGGEGGSAYRDAARRFAASAHSQIGDRAPAAVSRSVADIGPGERLRVGFVSGDLYAHPVAFFLEAVLKHMDRTGFELIAYSNNAFDDDTTASLRPLFDEWHAIRHLSDDDAAALKRSHRIDVLFDLGGHTGESRVQVFARRPAATQVSWPGYFASTGLAEMDYLIGDPVSNPVDSTEWFSETIFRMPHMRLCMSIPQAAADIPVAAPPCVQKGFVTFGCFQQVAKITPRVLRAWSMVLRSVPGSRLHLQTRELGTPSIRDRLAADLTRAGIDPARVTLAGSQALQDYLQSHDQVDILLDTFPYPGGTTTAFALYMGVPTVTLSGDTMLARQGASMLACVGMDEWVAVDEPDYVRICARMAADTGALAQLRAGLRARALASPLFDAQEFSRHFGAAVVAMHERRELPAMPVHA